MLEDLPLPFDALEEHFATLMHEAADEAAADVSRLIAYSSKKTAGIAKTAANITYQAHVNNSGVMAAAKPVMDTAFRLGLEGMPSHVRREVLKHEGVVNGLEAQAEYYAKNYVNRVIRGVADRALAKGKDVQQAIEKAMKGSKSYFDAVSNATVSRAYHYGMLKSAEVQGQRWAILVAVRDHRTSPLCKKIDGRRIPIGKAVDVMEKNSRLRGAAVNKTFIPFKTIDDPKTNITLLKSLGAMVPPFHPHCRTTLIIQ